MTRTIHAKFVAGRFEPTGTLDLPEGCEVELTIAPKLDTAPAAEIKEDRNAGLRRTAGAWNDGSIDADKLLHDIYESRRQPSTRPVPKF